MIRNKMYIISYTRISTDKTIDKNKVTRCVSLLKFARISAVFLCIGSTDTKALAPMGLNKWCLHGRLLRIIIN